MGGRSCDDVSGDFGPSASRAGYAADVKRLGWIALLAGCGFQGTSPVTPIDSSTPVVIDASVPGDIAVTPPPIDARQCFGIGLLKLCLSAPPTGDVTLPAAIN